MSIVVEHIVSFIVRLRPRLGGQLLRTLLTSGALFFLFAFHLSPLTIKAQTPDSLRRERLEEIEISAQRAPSELRTAAPTQVLDAEYLEHSGALQLSDAIKQMAGVTLKDYGGVGGIKTVSARGLGSQFSTITIDGIPVDDSQNGQVDLGRYTLGNAAYVSLSQGQEQSPLLSARAYAAGSTLNMETSVPSFWPGEHVKLKAGLEGGSFGFFSPALLWEQWWNRKLRSSFYVNYLRSDGDYPFTLYYTASRQDSSSVERRNHSAVWMLTADGNLFYTIDSGNTLMVKAHYMRGEHQLPGPVHFYSQENSNENTREEVAFLQAKWKVERGKWKTQVLGKFQATYDFYEDSSSTSITGYLFNEYRQREGYLSASTDITLSDHFSLDFAADGDLSHLESNLATRNDVTRSKLIAVAAAKYQLSPFTFHLNLVYNNTLDHVVDLDTTPHFQRLSPFLSAMCSLGEGTTLRLFYKETFRVPSFGELYFFQSLPRNLRPECAHQLNLGITHAQEFPLSTFNFQLSTTIDAYYNRVTDKIVARLVNGDSRHRRHPRRRRHRRILLHPSSFNLHPSPQLQLPVRRRPYPAGQQDLRSPDYLHPAPLRRCQPSLGEPLGEPRRHRDDCRRALQWPSEQRRHTTSRLLRFRHQRRPLLRPPHRHPLPPCRHPKPLRRPVRGRPLLPHDGPQLATRHRIRFLVSSL